MLSFLPSLQSTPHLNFIKMKIDRNNMADRGSVKAYVNKSKTLKKIMDVLARHYQQNYK